MNGDEETKCFVNFINKKNTSKSILISKDKINELNLDKIILKNTTTLIKLYDNKHKGKQVLFYEIETDEISFSNNIKLLSYEEHILQYLNKYKTNKISKYDELKMTFLKNYSQIQKPNESIIDLQNKMFLKLLIAMDSKELLNSRHGRDLQVYRSDIELPFNEMKKKPRNIAIGVILNTQNDQLLMIERSKKKGLIFPKGGCDSDEWPLAGISALRETWEESGVICKIEKELFNKLDLNGYSLNKIDKNHSFSVYQMSVIEMKDNWPECEKRSNCRFWLTYKEAKKMFNEAGNFDSQLKEMYLKILDKSDVIKV